MVRTLDEPKLLLQDATGSASQKRKLTISTTMLKAALAAYARSTEEDPDKLARFLYATALREGGFDVPESISDETVRTFYWYLCAPPYQFNAKSLC